MSARDDMRDWPIALKLNHEATRLAPMIYYCKTQVYGGSMLLWDGLSPASQQMYVAIAGQLLQTFKPEAAPANPGKPATLHLV